MRIQWEKLIAAALCLALVLGMGACSEKQEKKIEITPPSQVVSEVLDATQEGDYDNVTEVLNPDSDEMRDLLGKVDASREELTEDQQETFDMVAEMFRDFDYEIVDEKINGDKAEVDVAITTYDYQGMLKKLLSKMSGKGLSMAMSSQDKDQMMEALKEDFIDRLGPALKKTRKAGKTKTTEATLNLTRDGDSWTIGEMDESAVNALTGGLMYEVAGLASMMDLTSGE